MRALVGLFIVLVASSLARAEPRRSFALHFTRAKGAERCIDPRSLARRVEDLTGPALVAPGSADVTLEASIAPYQRGFRASVYRLGAAGDHAAERVFTSATRDCRTLDAVLAFILALAIDPSLSTANLPPELLASFAQETPPEEQLLDELEQQPARPVVLAVAPPPTFLPDPPPPIPPSPKERAHYALSLGLAGNLRTLPVALLGVQATFILDLPRVFPLVASVRSFLRSSDHALSAETSASFRGDDGQLSICPLGLLYGRLRVRGCAGLAFGRLRARGAGFDHNRDARLWDAAALANLALWLRISKGFGILTEAGVRLRFLSSDFELQNQSGQRGVAVQPQQVGFGLFLGPSYEF